MCKCGRALQSPPAEALKPALNAACVGMGGGGLGCKVPPGSRFRGVFAGFRARESAVTHATHFCILTNLISLANAEYGQIVFVLGVFMDWSVFVTFSTTPVNLVYKNLLEDFEGAMKS